MRMRKLMLPPFHGEAIAHYAELIEQVTHREIDTWRQGDTVRTRTVAQTITMEVIIRAVFGISDPARIAELQRFLPRLSSPSPLLLLVQKDLGPRTPWGRFVRLRDHVAGGLASTTAEVVTAVVGVLDAAREVSRRLEPLTAVPLQPARADVRAQLARLVYPGFIAATGVDRLPDVERYLRAAARRLERLPDVVAVDRDRMNTVHELERAYRERLAAVPGSVALREVPWMLEELRVSHFAQSLGTRGPISAKRIRRALAEAG
jgi:ATP-dependent helicase HrpA